MKLIDGDGHLHDLPDSSSSDLATIRRKLADGWVSYEAPDGADPATWRLTVEHEITRRRRAANRS